MGNRTSRKPLNRFRYKSRIRYTDVPLPEVSYKNPGTNLRIATGYKDADELIVIENSLRIRHGICILHNAERHIIQSMLRSTDTTPWSWEITALVDMRLKQGRALLAKLDRRKIRNKARLDRRYARKGWQRAFANQWPQIAKLMIQYPAL